MSDQPKTPGAMVLDTRPDLRRFGYAPGNYMGTCLAGNHTMTGLDKRATCCLECAERLLAEQTPAVGGLDWSKSVYEHCRSCKGWLPLLDGGCRPCTELRAALARIAELEAQIAKANDWSHLKPDMG